MDEVERRRAHADYQREYNRKNSERINARRRSVSKERKAELAAARRAWRSRNLEHIRVRERAAHQRNKAKKSIANRAWRALNREAVIKRTRAWYATNADKLREAKDQKVYGLSPGGYKRLLDSQSGVCAICCEPEKNRDKRTGRPRRLAVDHDHVTSAVRGLLCSACNAAIGHFDDDCDRLAKAIAYLKRAQDAEKCA